MDGVKQNHGTTSGVVEESKERHVTWLSISDVLTDLQAVRSAIGMILSSVRPSVCLRFSDWDVTSSSVGSERIIFGAGD